MAAIPTAKHIPVGAELSLYWISGSSRHVILRPLPCFSLLPMLGSRISLLLYSSFLFILIPSLRAILKSLNLNLLSVLFLSFIHFLRYLSQFV